MKNILPAALALILAACTVGPNYHAPEEKLPVHWLSTERKIDDAAMLQQAWWKQFNDPVLDILIAKAAADNFDLKIAEARIAQARANVGVAQSSLLPKVDASATVNRQANRIAFPGPIDLSKPFNTFQAGFDASWELDLFGGVRRDVEAQQANFSASEATRDDMRISLLAEVARNYVAIRTAQANMALAQIIVEANQKTLDIAKERFAAGDIAGVDVTRAQAQLEKSQADIPHYRDQIAQSEFALDVLLGEQPGAAHELVKEEGAIPLTPNNVALITPASAIANRPDIRVAERGLAAATAEQGVAAAKFFPDISLSGFIGLLNVDAGDLLKSGSRSWNGAGSVVLPILNYGALSANLDVANAKQQEALANYQKTIIAALSDVERSVSAYEQGLARAHEINKAVESSDHAVKVAEERYKEGLTSMLELLDAKRSLYEVRYQQISEQSKTADHLIALYKSFGGAYAEEMSQEVTVN